MSGYRTRTVFFVAVAAGFIFLYGFFQCSDDRDRELSSRPIGLAPNRVSGTRHIGLIGDSWVADGRLETPLRASFEKRGITVQCRSEGYRGADSRRIRMELFRRDSRTGYQIGLLSDPEIHLIVVIGGVNDVLEHRGPVRYATEMIRLADDLAALDIETCIVEIARFGHGSRPNIPRMEAVLRFLRKALYEDGSQDPIVQYRNALRERLKRFPNHSTRLIDPDPVIPDYSETSDLYSNAYHLNTKGDSVLAGLIAGSLAEHVTGERPCTSNTD